MDHLIDSIEWTIASFPTQRNSSEYPYLSYRIKF